MGFLFEHWQGDFSVSKAVWVSGLIALLVCLPVSILDVYCFMVANNIHGVADVMARAEGGDMSFVQPPLFLRAFEQLLDTATMVWWSVGTWRSCANPDAKGVVRVRGFLKLSIIAGVLYGAYDLFDFVKTALSA
ncbi:MAG: hypothetical protein P4M15_05830 [Alphaproteobacteria bacterium]|nr:hypothetical protein [Alphaproteobacteria bacterium]